jgi:hypothetical protein
MIVGRLVTTSGYKQSFSTLTAVMGNLQNLSAQKTQFVGGSLGKTFVFYCDGDANLLENDQLRDYASNRIFKVKTGGVTRRFYGIVDMLEVIVEETK